MPSLFERCFTLVIGIALGAILVLLATDRDQVRAEARHRERLQRAVATAYQDGLQAGTRRR